MGRHKIGFSFKNIFKTIHPIKVNTNEDLNIVELLKSSISKDGENIAILKLFFELFGEDYFQIPEDWINEAHDGPFNISDRKLGNVFNRKLPKGRRIQGKELLEPIARKFGASPDETIHFLKENLIVLLKNYDAEKITSDHTVFKFVSAENFGNKSKDQLEKYIKGLKSEDPYLALTVLLIVSLFPIPASDSGEIDLLETIITPALASIIPANDRGQNGLLQKCSQPSLFSDNTRKSEITQIDQMLSSSNLVIIHGEAGMGKSELAKIYAKASNKKYKAIQFVSAENGIKKAIISIQFIGTSTEEIKTDDDAKEVIKRNMKLLSELEEENLLIFDNLDYPSSQDIQSLIELTGIKAKIIVTSRHDFRGHDRLNNIFLNPLSETVAIQLFYSYYTNGVSSQAQDRTDLIKLLTEIGSNTLFIKLIASTLQNNFITINELQTAFETFDYNNDIWVNVEHYTERDGIETVNQNMLGHLKVIFNISTISKDTNSVLIMQAMALIPYFGINNKRFYEIFFKGKMERITYLNTIHELAQNGWLEIDVQNLRLHPAISYLMIAEESLRPKPLQIGNENNSAFHLYNYICPLVQQINDFQFFNGNSDEINDHTASAIEVINMALFMIPRVMCYEENFFYFLCQVSTSCRLFDLQTENQRLLKHISEIAENDAFKHNDTMAMKATRAYFDVAMFYTFTDEYHTGEEFLRYENLPNYVKRGIQISPLLYAIWINNLYWCIFNQSKDYEHCLECVTAFAKEIIKLEKITTYDTEVKKEISSLYYNIGVVLSNPVMKLNDDDKRIRIFTSLAELFGKEINPEKIRSKFECYDLAEGYLQQAIDILHQIYTIHNADTECTREINQIAFIWKCRARISDDPKKKQDFIKKAIQKYSNVLELRIEKYGKTSHYLATQYRNLADAYRELFQTTRSSNDYDLAIHYYDQALNLQEKLYGRDARFLNWLIIKNDFIAKNN